MHRFLNSLFFVKNLEPFSFSKFLVSNEQSLFSLSALINHESRRFGRRYRRWYHWPNDFLPFHWERPKQEPPYLRTGDAVRDIGFWDSKALILGAENSKLLSQAPEVVRRQFTLEFAERPDILKYQTERIVSMVRRYSFDELSNEVLIAKFTVKIRNNLHHLTKIDKNDAPRKIRQNNLWQKRKKLLNELYYQNRERYDWLVKFLGITHQVPKLGLIESKPTRKGELRRLTREYCDRIKEERLNAYHEELKAKQSLLNEEMLKVQKLIEQDEKYLGITNKEKTF